MITTTTPFAVLIELDGDGAHPAAWRAVRHRPTDLLSGGRIAATARAAERAGFTAASFDDSPLPPAGRGDVIGRIDAVQRASFAAPLTAAIGLLPVAHAVYSEPFHVATQTATVDHVSDGRAGWIVGIDADAAIAAEYGRASVSSDQAIADAADAVEVARRLWDSWEDDAVIRETATGRYFDRERVHYADFVGESFSVKGPAIIPRPPQGQLVVFAAGELAGRLGADVALLSSRDEVAAARAAGVPRVVLELEVILDTAGVSAADRLAALDAHSDWTPTRRERFVGTSAELTAHLAELTRLVDGVRVIPAVLDLDLDEVGRAVLPELRRRGLFRSPVVGQTLRESFGLDRPENRFSSGNSPSDRSTTLEGARA